MMTQTQNSGIQHHAMPSHRDRGVHPNAECFIAPDTGRSRNNYFAVYFYGQMEGRFPRLAEAKNFAEMIYGPLPWKRIKGDQSEHFDPVWGQTSEFNDASVYYVVDKLPLLGYGSRKTSTLIHRLAAAQGIQTTAIDDETVAKSVLISLTPPHSITHVLMEASGATEPFEDQHITLIYIPDKTGVDPTALAEVVEEWAANAAPLVGRVEDFDAFRNDTDVLYAAWDFDDGSIWRNDLLATIREAGIVWEETYPEWIPHQTMSYLDKGALETMPTFPEDASLDVMFGSITMSYGHDAEIYPIGRSTDL